jgi:outer membrane protein assembly factor BamB
VDPLDDSKAVSFYIKAGVGRTSSSPAPLDLDKNNIPESFAVGLDQGSFSGELRIYSLDDILDIEKNGEVIQVSENAKKVCKLMAGLVASFSVEDNILYFGDCQSNIYGYDAFNQIQVMYNGDLRGNFSNRSPALTSSRVYFPAVGRSNEKGSVIAVNRATGTTEWIKKLQARAQTAPIVLRSPGGDGIIEGTGRTDSEKARVAVLNPENGETITAPPVDLGSPPGGSPYGNGISGELGASGDALVAAMDQGIVVWRLLRELDLVAVDLDPGVNEKAEPGKIYHGRARFKFSGKYKAGKSFTLAGAGVGVLVNNTPVENLVLKGAPLPSITYSGKSFQAVPDIADGQEFEIEFDWKAPGENEAVMKAFINLDMGNVAIIWDENTYDNNMVMKNVGIRANDIGVEIVPGRENPWKTISTPAKLFATVKVYRKDTGTESLPVKLTMNGAAGEIVREFDLEPGGKYKSTYEIEANEIGSYTIEAQAWPLGDSWQDVRPADNVASIILEYIRGATPDSLDSQIHAELGGSKKDY